MKVLVLADSFLPHAGGSRVYYYNLYKHLAAGFSDQITILTRKIAGWEAFDESYSTPSLRIIRRQKPLPDWKYRQLPKVVLPFWDTFRIVRKDGIDLIHAGDLFPPGLIGLALERFFRIPYLVYCHGEELVKTDRYRYQPILRNKIYRNAEAVIAASEFARSQLLRVGISEKKVHKITPGVDCEHFCPRPPSPDLIRQFGLQGKTVLLTVARLYARKGHDVVLRALAGIAGEFPGLRYVIVGKGPEEERLRRLSAELGISGIVTFVGYVPEEQLPDFYNLCDLFVMANREEMDGDIEGFGMVFLEANACGKAVIGGRSGGTAEAIVHDGTGYQVDPQDVDQLAIVLKYLLENRSLREELGAAGLKRARSEFSWKSRAERLRQISDAVLHGTSLGEQGESVYIPAVEVKK